MADLVGCHHHLDWALDERDPEDVDAALPPEGDRLVVQATYYLPDGSGKKLFGQRVIKAGE